MSGISCLFIIRGVNLNNTLYCWDTFIVWGSAINYSKQFFLQPIVVLKDLLNSINYADYNSFLGALMALPMHVIGSDFVSYVLIGWIMFFIPFGIIFSLVINIIMSKIGWNKIPNSLSFLLALLLPAISNQMFYGYMYISALLPGIVLLLIALIINFETVNWKLLSIMGVISIIVVIQNRTLAYMIVGYFISVFIYKIWFSFINTTNLKKNICNIIIAIFYIIILNTLILLIFFKGFFERSLFNNYSVAYSAYSTGLNIFERILSTINYFGLIIIGLLFLGMIIGFIEKKLRLYTIMMLIWIIIPTLLINSILNMNGHQMYTIIIPILILIEYILCYIYNKKYILKYKKICCCIFIFVLCINFMYAFSNSNKNYKYLGYVHHPLIGYDINTIKLIVSDLKNLSKNKYKIYCISSNGLFNDDTLQKSNVPKELISLPSLNITSHVDLRDGFYTSFFDSDFVIVADPVQTHLLSKDQQVITILGNIMLTDNEISRHFKLIKIYDLKRESGSSVKDEIIKVKIYKKILPFNEDNITYIEKIFDEQYEDYPELFHNRFEEYKSKHFK